MQRKTIVTFHLLLAAFLAPLLIMIAVSGGLYLLDFKGEVEQQTIYSGELGAFDPKDADQKSQVDAWLSAQGISFDYEYTRGSSTTIYTRPTSREHLVFRIKDQNLTVVKQSPDLVKTLVELHKGHGPSNFKTLQKIAAFGLLFIVISGMVVGLMAPAHRRKTIASVSLGGIVTLLLAML